MVQSEVRPLQKWQQQTHANGLLKPIKMAKEIATTARCP
jgi:hypothetical protein